MPTLQIGHKTRGLKSLHGGVKGPNPWENQGVANVEVARLMHWMQCNP